MSTYGVLKAWDEERGFGFIEPAQGGKDVFVRATAFAPGSERPQVKQCVRFQLEIGPEGQAQASQVEPALPATRLSVSRDEAAAHWTMALRFALPAFLGLYLLLALVWEVPSLLAVIYLAASAITLGAHAMDKYASKRGLRRNRKAHCMCSPCSVAGRAPCWRITSCATSRPRPSSASGSGSR